jgi:hypothetical protein
MAVVSYTNLRKIVLLLSINGFFYAQTINANEWQSSFESKSSFSGYSSPSDHSQYRDNNEDKPWSNGKSFNDGNRVRYSAAISKNPWKPVSSPYYRKSFGSQRPWGNVPDRKRSSRNSMKFYDQRFKQWSHQREASKYNGAYAAPLTGYGRSPVPYANPYGYPGPIYSDGLMTPPIYPAVASDPLRYGGYRSRSFPNAGLLSGPWLW